MAKDLSKILIIDLEATCWERETERPSKEVQEIIEIGIAEVDLKKRIITRNEGILIKPQFSTVSEFCTKLTTITPELLETQGISYPEALEKLKKDYGPLYSFGWGSYGDFDREMFKQNDALYKVSAGLGRTHLNVKNLFALKHKISREVGLSQALNILKLELEGTHHRGLDDAKNIAKILLTLL